MLYSFFIMASEIDLNITQGSDFVVNLVVYDDFGAVLNLTNHSVSGLVKNRYGDASGLFDLSPTVSDAANGVVNIDIGASKTKDFPAGKFHYGIEVGSGDVAFKPLLGNILVYPEVNA